VQSWASLMTLWRSRAGVLLSAVLGLEASIFVYAKTVGAHNRVVGVVWSETTSSTGFLLALCVVEAFLVWRVWRGGYWPWFLLLYLVGVRAGKTLAATAFSFGLYSLGLEMLLLAQLALLISPAIRGRRHRTPVASSL
jgi:hypothetical protein